MENEKTRPGMVEATAPKTRVIVISASLNPESLSFRLAQAAEEAVRRVGAEATLLDLREWDLPLCDGDESYSHPGVEKITEAIQSADAILLAAPIYNYDLNAAAKNLLELTGSAWSAKPVGFLCAAGGRSSYMAPIGLANSLMFDFRSWIVPRFVYATGGDFSDDRSASPRIMERINQLAQELVKMARALAWASNPQGSALAGLSPAGV